jgi:hypothetical protein
MIARSRRSGVQFEARVRDLERSTVPRESDLCSAQPTPRRGHRIGHGLHGKERPMMTTDDTPSTPMP